jgi:enhancing lycopene biosynthesis protein 2
MPKIAVILSGCGVFDGAEIHESVLTLLALDRAGVEVICAAPDADQLHVIDHRKSQPVSETRNILAESARIARGNIKPLSALTPAEVDGAILPGGFGAAKNLSTFAVEGTNATVRSELVHYLKAMQEAGKPLGFACIAPAIAAQVFGPQGVKFTIGTDAATAKALETWGGKHEDCAVNDIVVDEKLKIVTTPAYMLAQRITEAESGINKMVEAVVKFAGR